MRKMTWALLVSVLVFNTPSAFPQSANIYTFNPDVKVTDAVPYDGTSSVFFSSGQHYTAFRGDTVYVVWWESRISNPPTGNHVFFAKSTDCGATFGASKRVDDIPAGFNPSMRVDSSGVIYVAYERQNNIYFTKSTNGGDSFTPSILVVDSAAILADQKYPSIAVNDRGHVFIAWTDNRNGYSAIFSAASYDGGSTFKKNIRVGSGNNGGPFDIAVDEHNRVYIAYGDTFGGQIGLVVAGSQDSGQSFTSFALASQGPLVVGPPSLAVSKAGNVGVVYEQGVSFSENSVRFSISNNFGQSFSQSVRVDTAYTGPDCYNGDRPSLAVNKGIFYVAWSDGRVNPLDSNCLVNIFLSYSPDGGRSFVTEVGKDTSAGGAYADPHRPSLTVNEQGKAFVAWIDDRIDPWFQDYQYVFGATAVPHFIKGDLNLDATLTAADVVLELNAVFSGGSFPASLETADVNCDAELTPADVVLHLNATFLGESFPC